MTKKPLLIRRHTYLKIPQGRYSHRLLSVCYDKTDLRINCEGACVIHVTTAHVDHVNIS